MRGLGKTYTISSGNGCCETIALGQMAQSDSRIRMVSWGATSDIEDNHPNNTEGKTIDYAILAENVTFSHRNNKRIILNGLSMRIPKGSIYGLTGSSGCGKSTLISCILGTRSVNAGDIYVFGWSTKNPQRGNMVDIPGKGVGFMPQELALYSKFTTQEILLYFGRLYGVSMNDIKKSTNTLLDLLQLSQTSTRIEFMSGGQKRRVSFAVSLIHTPKLLVLDEPTVGMDPLLRLRIWDHLQSLVKEEQVTVLITSHYLDEMRKADMVGVMRDGKIIAENSPAALLNLCSVTSLDDAVLNLCKSPELLAHSQQMMDHEIKVHQQDVKSDKKISCHIQLKESFPRLNAVVIKNLYTLLRNVPLLLFVICVPAIQLLVVLLMGYEPTKLSLGVFNQELYSAPLLSDSNISLAVPECPHFPPNKLNSCELSLLGCRFLNHVSSNKINLKFYNLENEAIKAVREGNIYGYLTFGKNFSTSLVDRALKPNGKDILDTDILQSQILSRFDQSNTVIYRLLLKDLHEAQEVFLTSLLSSCGANPKFAEYPIQYRDPVFGRADDYSFSHSLAPGSTVPFMFFFSIISSGLRFVEERNCGTLERMLIAGVKLSEIMMSFMVSELLIISVQSSLILALLSWWLPMMPRAELLSFCFAFLLMILAGYTGVSFGFVVGSLCTEQVQVAIIALAFIFPNILFSGIIWPVEGMPDAVQTIVNILPCSLSSASMSSIWSRGLCVTHPSVWPGFICLLVYIIVLNFLTLVWHVIMKK